VGKMQGSPLLKIQNSILEQLLAVYYNEIPYVMIARIEVKRKRTAGSGRHKKKTKLFFGQRWRWFLHGIVDGESSSVEVTSADNDSSVRYLKLEWILVGDRVTRGGLNEHDEH
jgi:hypothetical protein